MRKDLNNPYGLIAAIEWYLRAFERRIQNGREN